MKEKQFCESQSHTHLASKLHTLNYLLLYFKTMTEKIMAQTYFSHTQKSRHLKTISLSFVQRKNN